MAFVKKKMSTPFPAGKDVAPTQAPPMFQRVKAGPAAPPLKIPIPQFPTGRVAPKLPPMGGAPSMPMMPGAGAPSMMPGAGAPGMKSPKPAPKLLPGMKPKKK